MNQNLLLYMGIVEIFIIVFFNILVWVFNKNKLFNKIISLFSITFITFTLFNVLCKFFNFKFIFIFQTISISVFIGISLLIILTFSKKLINLENAFKELSKKNFSYKHNLKIKGDFKNFIKIYLDINKNFEKLSEDILKLTGDLDKTLISLNEKINLVDSNIKEQKTITDNFNMAIDVLCKSAEIGATGLDETRRMFNENAEKFNTLFDKIKILFSQNLNMQKENQNMEKFSLSAIRFSIDLNDVTKSGTKKIDAIVGSIESFSNSVKKIVDMINLIKKISAQTNLLAINASIEAAHAGDAGQGFAVVADEIRQLSESSSKVTSQITDIVEGITKELSADQLKSKSAKEGIEDIKEAFSKNINFINLLADSINQQIESVDEMKENIENVHDLSKDIKNSAQSQQKTTQEIYEATETLNAQAFLIGQLIMRQKVNLSTITDSLDSLNNIIKILNKISGLLPSLKRNINPDPN